MNCPWCDTECGSRAALHAHLSEQHADKVAMIRREGRVFYEIACPQCGARHEQLVGKGGADPEFLAEFGTEIRMVAFDMLVHHMVGEHSQAPGQLALYEQSNVGERRETKR